jgi:hypothetical protein
MQHFFIGEDFTVRNETDAFLGHAIDASQIATVCDGKAKVIDGSVVVIQQRAISGNSE